MNVGIFEGRENPRNTDLISDILKTVGTYQSQDALPPLVASSSCLAQLLWLHGPQTFWRVSQSRVGPEPTSLMPFQTSVWLQILSHVAMTGSQVQLALQANCTQPIETSIFSALPGHLFLLELPLDPAQGSGFTLM